MPTKHETCMLYQIDTNIWCPFLRANYLVCCTCAFYKNVTNAVSMAPLTRPGNNSKPTGHLSFQQYSHCEIGSEY